MSTRINVPAAATLRTARIKVTEDGMIVRGAKLFINEGTDSKDAVVILAPADYDERQALAEALRNMANTLEDCPDHEAVTTEDSADDQG